MRIVPRLKRDSPCGRLFLALLVLSLSFFLSHSTPLAAQRLTWQDESSPFRRHVMVAPLETGMPTVVMAEFFCHGQLTDERPAVTVFARAEQVPSRVLQIGPGDFCRVAFETRKSETAYQLYYGAAQAAHEPPPWTAADGLLFETRRWQDCDLAQLPSVRQAYEASRRLGSDYVSQVFHRHNPCDVAPAPFLSHYSGTLHIRVPGRYQFFTSSEDCSFLLIDEKLVVSAPGRHGPTGDARHKGDVQLDTGEHRFDYWHAAAGLATCAVAAWQVPDAAQLQVIPASAFGTERTARVAALHPEHVHDGPVPDFRLAIHGEAPIEDSDQWAIRVEFEGAAPTADRHSTCSWEFGDGQTSTQWQPTHVYLQPGEYSVTLRVRRRGKERESVNRVPVTRFIQQSGAQNKDTLDDYLPLLDQYELATLDAPSLMQMVRLRLQREEWAKAIETGMRVLAAAGGSVDDGLRWETAAMLDPIARRQLGDAEAALRLWKAAGHAIQDPQRKALCALAAADVALNELLQTEEARAFLELADERLKTGHDVESANLSRIWGDWHARRAEAAASLAAYQLANEKRGLGLNVAQQNARRGAFSRSAEALLRDADLPRAAEQLSQWQQDFPQDKTEGYLSTLLARYWMARNNPRVALAVAGDLLAIAPESPYADQLVLVQAAAEEMLGHTDRAIAACETLLTNYPGSPLREVAQAKIAALKGTSTGPKGAPGTEQTGTEQTGAEQTGTEQTPKTKKTPPREANDQKSPGVPRANT